MSPAAIDEPRISDPPGSSPDRGAGSSPVLPQRTRLAPSPTGALHLGNARTFLLTWAMARRRGWSIPLRIEDLDTPRIKPGTTEALVDTLRWLGLDWDPPAANHSATLPLCHSVTSKDYLVQSHDLEPYRAAMRFLAARGLAYPCPLTRAEIERAASAPQEGAHDTPFPAHLRPASAGQPFDFDAEEAAACRGTGVGGAPVRTAGDMGANWRFIVPSTPVTFHDLFAGEQTFDVSAIVGDFVLWTKRGTPSYQLAVVVDDLRQHITHVLRGDDLLDSAARQILLYRAFASDPVGSGFHPRPGTRNPEPVFCHFPLVLGPDGRRLAKRHGDTRLDHYRAAGVPAEAVVGLIAHWSGVLPARRLMSAREFADAWRADLNTIPRAPITFSPEDDQWLLSQA